MTTMRATAVLSALLLALGAQAQEDPRASGEAAQPAYRVGAVPRIAILPVRCARDMEESLCTVIDESLGVHLSRDPRLDVVGPRDLEALVGGQQLMALANCEGDACFGQNIGGMPSIQASYMLSVAIGRLGSDALITARLIDLGRNVVIDRDDARVRRNSENEIDAATRELVETVLIRRGLGTPRAAGAVAEESGSPGVFWGGVVASGLGGVGLLAAGGLGAMALVNAQTLAVGTNIDQTKFDDTAATARGFALGSDLALVGGGALIAAGVTMMIVGSL